jgi:hypothetical protein
MNFYLSILLILIFFPYVGFLPGYDTQPLYHVLSLPFVVFILYKNIYNNNIKQNFFLFFIISSIIVSVTLFSDFSIQRVIKILLPFYTIISTYLLSRFSIKNNYLKKIIIYSFLFYLFVGTVQTFFDSEFLSFLTFRGTDIISIETTGRGVSSLASEPSKFGKIINLFGLLFLFCTTQNNKKIFFKVFIITFFSVLLLSKSVFALIFVLITFLIYFILNFKPNLLKLFFITTISISSLFLFSSLLINKYLPDSRIRFLVDLLFENPELLSKQGAFVKLFNPLICIEAYYHQMINPNLVYFYSKLIPLSNGELYLPLVENYYGGIFEVLNILGVFGFIILTIFLTILIRQTKTNKNRALLLSILPFLLIEGSLNTPTYWFCFFIITKNKKLIIDKTLITKFKSEFLITGK